MVDFRNALSQEYNSLNYEIVKEVLQTGFGELSEFSTIVEEWLQITPLAEKMRPHSSEALYGKSLLDPLLVKQLEDKTLPLTSVIFWGPPGCGKTTIARLLGESRKDTHHFVEFECPFQQE